MLEYGFVHYLAIAQKKECRNGDNDTLLGGNIKKSLKTYIDQQKIKHKLILYMLELP